MNGYLVILPVVAVLATAGCADPVSHGDDTGEALPLETLFQSGSFFELSEEPAYVVLRSEEDEARFLAAYPRNVSYAPDRSVRVPPFPEVDYGRYMVLGVALGRRGDGNTIVRVDSAVVVERQLVVHSTEVDPWYEHRYFSNPAHFVMVPRQELPVSFAPVQLEEAPRP